MLIKNIVNSLDDAREVGSDLRESLDAFPDLEVCENFFSFQGEGRSVGVPAYFIRFTKCHRRCTWCDSKFTWTSNETRSVDSLLSEIENSPARLAVITGGEPLLYQNKKNFLAFLLCIENLEIPIEIETEGSLVAAPWLLEEFNHAGLHFNVSPKLPGSGILWTENYTNSLKEWVDISYDYENVTFKFVITGDKDFEFLKSLETRFEIDKRFIFVMAEGDTTLSQLNSMELLAERAMKEGYSFSPRLHTLIWSDARGK